MIVAFKGDSYQQDCGIYISETIKKFDKNARLQREGVVVFIDADKIENIREELQKELGHPVKVFTPES